VVKRTRRLEVPVDQYPNFNFVGRILGPGELAEEGGVADGVPRAHPRRGSIKDPAKVCPQPLWDLGLHYTGLYFTVLYCYSILWAVADPASGSCREEAVARRAGVLSAVWFAVGALTSSSCRVCALVYQEEKLLYYNSSE